MKDWGKKESMTEENPKNRQHPEYMRMSELSAYAETSITAIRFYLRENLLPQPLKTSKTMAYYTEEHLNALLEIRRLKEEGLPLEAIKGIIRHEKANLLPGEEKNTIHTSKREQIIKSAVTLFRKKGYDETKISDIPGLAGVGKGTFYQNFRNKEELFIECADSIFREIGENIPEIQEEADPIQKLRNRGYYFGHFQSHLVEMLNLIRGAALKGNPHVKEKLDEVMRNLIEPVREDLETAIRQGKIRLKDSTLLAHLLMGAAEYLIYYSYDNMSEFDANQDKLWDIISNGIFKKEISLTGSEKA